MSDQDVFDNILENREKPDLTKEDPKITVILPNATFFQTPEGAGPLYYLVSNLTKIVNMDRVPTEDGKTEFRNITFNAIAKQYMTDEVMAGIKQLGGEIIIH